MYVGIIQVELELPGVDGLKARRSLVRSLKDRLRARFKVAVAEVGVADEREEVTLGIALVGNDPAFVQRCCQGVINYLERERDARVTDSQMEIL